MGIGQRLDGVRTGKNSACYIHGRSRTPEYVRETAKRWQENHRPKRNAQNRAWAKRNPDKVVAANRRTHAERRAFRSFSKADLDRIWQRQKGRCVYCHGVLKRHGSHLDHIRAVARGGSNDSVNLQFLCASCNLKKQAQPPEMFARSMGWLL